MKKRFLAGILLLTILSSMFLFFAAEKVNAIEEREELYTTDSMLLQDFEASIRANATSNKAIVIIPGVGATTLTTPAGEVCWIWVGNAEKIACTTSGVSELTLTVGLDDYGVFNLYEDLYNMLKNYYGDEYNIIFYGYDWRNALNAITNLEIIASYYSELILVAHSMGGIVASKFCAKSSANRSKIDKMITLGTPYTGTPELIYVAETGDFNKLLGLIGISDATIKSLVANFPCTYQLAPTTRYCVNEVYSNYIKVGTEILSGSTAKLYYSTRPWAMNDGATKPMYSSATSFHNSLMISGTHVANSSLVDVYKIVGYGRLTKTQIIYDEEGNYVDYDEVMLGDGTVPQLSASNTLSLTQANKCFSVACDHMGLISNSTVFSYIRSIIDETVATESSMPLSQVQVNEKGWILSEDNRYIQIIIGGDTEIIITDGTGREIYNHNGSAYNVDGEYIGSVGYIGDNKIKYSLKNGKYCLVNSTQEVMTYLEVRYQDDGYYQNIVVYDNLTKGDYTVNISSHETMQVAVCAYELTIQVGEPTVDILEPSHVFTVEELNMKNK